MRSDDGEVPLVFLFSGTIFSRTASGFGVEQVPWDLEAGYRMPVRVWRDLMDSYFPNTAWLRLDRDTVADLSRFKAARALPTLGSGFRDAAGTRRGARAMSLAAARAVADAVLYEGYLLYPYRASSSKNLLRWQFGVVGPPGAAESGDGEESSMLTECLLEMSGSGTAEIDVQARFLQVQVRSVERAVRTPSASFGGGMAFEPVDELTVGPATWVRWHEAIEGVVELRSISVSGAAERLLPLHIPAGEDVELLIDDGGRVVGRLVRTRFALEGLLRVRFHPAGPAGLVAVSVALENRTEPVAAAGEQVGPDKPRDVAARFSFVGAHLLLAARGAIFLSMTDPPDFAIEATADCRNHRCWPVLVGEQGSHDTVLASPIILSDYPEIADESPGDLYDSTEIDEILTLRIMTMTDEEKRAARGTDPRAAAIIDRSDNLPPEIFERLHGACAA